jgi:hypothetical protein
MCNLDKAGGACTVTNKSACQKYGRNGHGSGEGELALAAPLPCLSFSDRRVLDFVPGFCRHLPFHNNLFN